MVQMTRLNYSAPHSWNDADMLQLCTFGQGLTEKGGTGMTLAESVQCSKRGTYSKGGWAFLLIRFSFNTHHAPHAPARAGPR